LEKEERIKFRPSSVKKITPVEEKKPICKEHIFPYKPSNYE
jgi:hypothetical protein